MSQVPVSEFSAILSGLSSLIVSSGLTYWVYKTQSSVISSLKEKIAGLENDIVELKADRSRWYHKAVRLAGILQETKSCPHSRTCQVKVKFERYIEEEGVI